MTTSRDELAQRIDTIESGYEFLLAYAAQGHESDKQAGPGQEVRDYLEAMSKALEGLGTIVMDVADANHGAAVNEFRPFLEALESDARKAGAAVRLVLAQEGISSQLVDNLNASIHLRALLTDLFIIDEAFTG